MSVFRPAVRVTAPDGREWEIYASKVRMPRRRPAAGTVFDDVGDPRAAVFSGLYWIGAGLLRGLAWLLVDLPVAAVRSLLSDEWTVEAITFGALAESHAWRTTREHRGQTLAAVEGSLARGEFPRPRNADYCSRSAR